MLVGSGGGLHDSGDDGGAAGRADGGRHEGAFKKDAIGRELVDGGSVVLVDGVVVAAHVGREILDKNPEDVGAFCFLAEDREEWREEQEEGKGEIFHGTWRISIYGKRHIGQSRILLGKVRCHFRLL